MSLLKSIGDRNGAVKSARRIGAGGVAGATVLPQVNLLPNEMVSARGLKSTRRMLGLVVVACLVVVLAGVYFTSTLVTGAEEAQATEQQRTETLLTEKMKYGEVPVILGRLAKTESNLELAASTEIQWADRLDAIMAVTPDGVTISSLVIANEGPVEGRPPVGDLFQRPSVGRLSFVALSATRPDTVAWLNNLETVDGFSDVRFADRKSVV